MTVGPQWHGFVPRYVVSKQGDRAALASAFESKTFNITAAKSVTVAMPTDRYNALVLPARSMTTAYISGAAGGKMKLGTISMPTSVP
jgi:hypothetical protein